MGIFSRILNREKKGTSPEEKKPAKERESLPAEIKTAPDASRGSGLGVLLAPHITEKSVMSGEQGIYTFRIPEGTSKIQVRDAVERKFGVKVNLVRVQKTRPKTRRIGRRSGIKPGITKAVVTLQEGERIELGT